VQAQPAVQVSPPAGKGFRLPCESVWEYAAQVGQSTARYRYPWGDDLSYSQICNFANGMDATSKAQVPGVTWTAASCSDSHAYTAPASSFKANAYGLHDSCYGAACCY
jgi:formylglycine-generating enzyme required for sulfatase activity